MEKLSQYDPLALTSIDFNIKSVKKYSTIATILASLSVIVLSVIINFQSIRHIWLPINELPIFYTVDKYSQYLQSENNPLCIATTNPFVYKPSLIVIKKVSDQLIQQIHEPLEGVGKFDYMEKHVKNTNYSCFDLAGVSFRYQGQKIIINTGLQGQGFYQILYRAISLREVLFNQEPFVRRDKFGFSIIREFKEKRVQYLDFIEVIKKDLLLINYQSQIIKGFFFSSQYFTNDYILSSDSEKLQHEIINFYSSKKTQNIQKYTIQRLNIGQIISQVLAWKGLILIPISCFFMFLPFVKSYLKMDLIKYRYTCPQLDFLDFSIWTQIRRKFTNCLNLPKERVLNMAFDNIDHELDILHILRKQICMKQRIGEVSSIDKFRDIFECEFDHQDMDQLLQLEKVGSCISITNNQYWKDFDFKEEYKEEGITDKIIELVKIFDESGTPIQVLSNGGKGYGSVWNMMALSMMLMGLVYGLILMGLFEVKSQTLLKTGVPYEEQQFTITFSQKDFSFRPRLEIDTRFIPKGWYYKAQIIDDKYNFIKNVQIVNGSKCVVPKGGQQYTWFCLSEDVDIIYKHNYYTMLHFEFKTSSTNRFDKMFTKGMRTSFYQRQVNLEDEKQVQTFFITTMGYYRHQLSFQKVIFSKDNHIYSIYQLKNQEILFADFSAGMFLKGTKNYIYADIQNISYRQILDNAWGLVILSFQLIIYRICRLINSFAKSKKIDPYKEEKRSNILSILKDVDRLGKKTYFHELCSVRHYFKQRIEGKQIINYLK